MQIQVYQLQCCHPFLCVFFLRAHTLGYWWGQELVGKGKLLLYGKRYVLCLCKLVGMKSS